MTIGMPATLSGSVGTPVALVPFVRLQRAAVHEAVVRCDPGRGVAFHPPAIPRAIRGA